MNVKQVLRVKPKLPSSGSRIALTHTLDQMLPFDIFINLNFFYQASSYLGKSSTRENLVTSLSGALDRYPVVAGSITEPEGREGLKLKTLVLDGRGADLIYEESSLKYADLPGGDSTKLIPRSIYGNGDPSAPLFMVKCTKVGGSLLLAIIQFLIFKSSPVVPSASLLASIILSQTSHPPWHFFKNGLNFVAEVRYHHIPPYGIDIHCSFSHPSIPTMSQFLSGCINPQATHGHQVGISQLQVYSST